MTTTNLRSEALSAAQGHWLSGNDQRRGVIPVYQRVQGRLDDAAVAGALEFVVTRHSPLTMRLVPDGDSYRQVLGDPSARHPVERVSAPGAERATIAEQVRTFAGVSMDLTQGEAFRVRIVELRPDDHLVLFNMHHLYADGWSIKLVVGDFWKTYAAIVRGGSPKPMLPPHDFADYVVEERLAGDELSGRQLEFWTAALQDNTAVGLMAEHPEHSGPDRSCYAETVLEPAELAALLACAREANVTGAALMFATMLLALRDETGQDDLTVTFMISGREERRYAQTLGLFTRRIPIRFRVKPGSSIAEFARSVMHGWSSAAAQSRPPYSTLALRRALDLDTESFGRTSRGPDLEVFVNFPLYPDFTSHLDGLLTVSGVEMNRQRPVVTKPRLMLAVRWANIAVVSAMFNEQHLAPPVVDGILTAFAARAKAYDDVDPARSIDSPENRARQS